MTVFTVPRSIAMSQAEEEKKEGIFIEEEATRHAGPAAAQCIGRPSGQKAVAVVSRIHATR
jgi:hypothetical protein